MRQLFFQQLLVFAFFLFCFFPAQATHIVSGELTYQCIGTKKYEFTLTVYSECDSMAILEKTYPIRYFSPSQGIPQAKAKTFNVNQFTEIEIPIYCNSVVTNCNGGSERGVKKVIYRGVVDLSAYDYAPDWTFYWVQAARSKEITTLLAPDQEDFFIQAEMNNLAAPCNNSPLFTGNPVITACTGDPKSFNNIAYDINGDALRYSLVTPKSSYEDEVVYLDGFDAKTFVPMNKPAQIDAVTGDITFTPTMQTIGITDVRVEEYRNGVLIGAVTRGLQITSIDCLNNPPVLSSFDKNDKAYFPVCAGDSVNLSISGSDEDAADVLSMSLLTGSSSQFQVAGNNSASPKGNFNWRPTLLDTGKHYFTIQLKDNACPKPEIVTKTYIIEVFSLPAFNLGTGQTLSCNDVVTLAPKVSKGDGNYTYAWSTGETTASIEATIGFYALTVTDGNDCASTAAIDFEGDLIANFSEEKKCLGAPTKFTDTSVSKNGNIILWAWDFGDGTTSSQQNPSHTYASAGVYQVGLTVTNNNTPVCTNTLQKEIVICPPLNINISHSDTCSHTNIVFEATDDAGNESCGPEEYVWDFGDGSAATSNTGEITHQYTTGGNYTVTLTAKSEAGCETVISKTINIYDTPLVNIIEDNFYLDCAQPDTVLHTVITSGGNGNLSYSWNIGGNKDSLEIDAAGLYAVTVTDELGCTSADLLVVTYPLIADFKYTPYCEEGDTIRFADASVANVDPITLWEWDFGNTNTSNSQNPKHLYENHGVYTANLRIEDANGCESERKLPVYVTLYNENEFSVEPKAVSICVSDAVQGIGPTAETGGFINGYTWDLGDGRTPLFTKDISTEYFAPDDYTLTLTMVYNKVTGVNDGCTRIFTEDIKVFPKLDVEINENRICQEVPVDFSFQRIAGDLIIPVVSATWNFGDGSAVSNELSPSHTYQSFNRFTVSLNVEDQNGCRKQVGKTVQVERVAHPDFLFEAVCAGTPTPFTINFYDTLENITNYFWNFGDGDTLSGLWPVYDAAHTFKAGSAYPVTLTISNTNSKCEHSVTKDVNILELSNINFTADTVCFGEFTTFTNLTTLNTGTITAYEWLFPDGSISTEKDPVKVISVAGAVPVQLVVHNSLNCTDTLTKNIEVKALPEADFYTDAAFLEAFQPLQFFDNSAGNVVTHFWDFGDGHSSTEKNPAHTYDSIAKYEVTYIVTNDLGCTDTLVRLTNLNVYLELPTAFSPNGDGNNDALGLIHRGIKELYDFKIYNRWGEMVFDAGNQLDKTWDGRLNGKPQGYGVYVVHVKAKAAYNIDFNFKKNVTLLR